MPPAPARLSSSREAHAVGLSPRTTGTPAGRRSWLCRGPAAPLLCASVYLPHERGRRSTHTQRCRGPLPAETCASAQLQAGPQWRPAAAAVMRVFLPILMRGPWVTDVAIFTCGSARPDSPPRSGGELRSQQERRSGRGLGQPRPRRPRSERAGSATRAAGSPHSRETCEGELSRPPTAQRHRCSDPDSNLSAHDNTVQCSGSVLETWMLRNLKVKVKVEK